MRALCSSIFLSQLVTTILLLLQFRNVVAVPSVPTPDLPWGDINLIVVTDVHSWVGGHGEHKEENLDADYGDVLSFVEHMKQYAFLNDQDVWFVMNGDWIDGTGIAMNGDPSELIPILEAMDFDLINVGNHELYENEIIQYAAKTGGMIQKYGDSYLSSNVLYTDTMKPIGHRSRILKGRKSNVLAFGFLYDMTNNADLVTVLEVETAVEEDWFVSAVKDTDSYDAILVLAHMDVRDFLCKIILSKIRALVGDNVPVQFITGHTHVRDTEIFDDYSTSVESGRYLDTIGFVSFPSKTTTKSSSSTTIKETAATEIAEAINATTNQTEIIATTAPLQESDFKYQFLDANVDILVQTLGISAEDFPTDKGIAQSKFIKRVQLEMGLRQTIGCVSGTYYTDREVNAPDSLWGFFNYVVVPTRISGNKAFFLGNGAWRYHLFDGDVRLDDAIAVSPFNNTFWKWENITSEMLIALNETLNAVQNPLKSGRVPNYILATPGRFQPDEIYTLIIDGFETEIIKNQMELINNYTITIPDPEEIPDLTTTSIWIDYFKQNSNTCKQAKGNKPNPDSPLSNTNTPKMPGFASADPAADTFRLIFVGVAVLVVAGLGSIAVWQKSTIFRDYTDARERETFNAMREFEGGGEVYEDIDGEDGEFI